MRLFLTISYLALVPALGQAQTAAEAQATIKFVQSLQQSGGGFVGAPSAQDAAAKPVSSLRATSAAIRSLKYFGGELPNRDKVTEFVKSCFDPQSGAYSDTPKGKPDVIVTAIGIMAAAELKLPADLYMTKAVGYLTANANEFEEVRLAAAGLEAADKFPKDAVGRWLADIDKLRNGDGSFGKPTGDARMTGSCVALILRIGGKMNEAQRKASLNVLFAGQRVEGAFGKADSNTSDLESSYRIVRALHMLNEKPKDVEKLKGYIAKCRNADGGYGVEPGKPSTVGGTYYAGIILHWLK
jgi:prenyltransferase beta subunit